MGGSNVGEGTSNDRRRSGSMSCWSTTSQPAKLLSYEVILEGLGENLIKASSATDALEHLLKTEIAVVLVDVCMPGFDGFELAAMIREHPRCQRTAIIFISAIHLADVDLMRGYQMGAADDVPGFDGVSSLPFNLLVPSFQCSVSRCCRTRSSANSFVAMIEDFRLVSAPPHLQLFPPSPAAALCPSLAHDLPAS